MKKVLFCFFSIIAVIELICIFIFDETILVSAGMFIWYGVDTLIGFIKNKEDKWMDFIFMCIYFCLFVINIVYILLKY